MSSDPEAAENLLSNPERLSALARYRLMGSAPEPSFDDLAALAAQVCQTPISFVNFLDNRRQWFKARVGLPVCEMPLDQAMCVHTLASPGLTIIPDLSVDPRTASAHYVGEPLHLRFYAGVRINDPDGQPLGTLCVIDHQPRPGGLTEQETSCLLALARQTETQLALHKASDERDRLARRALSDKALEFETLAENVSQLAWMAEPDGKVIWFNRRWLAYTGLSYAEATGGRWIDVHRPDRVQALISDLRMRWASGVGWEGVFELRGADGSYRPFLTRVEPIRDETGRVLRWFGTSTDISERIKAEDQLRELNASLQQRIDAALEKQARIEDQLRQSHKMEAVGQLTGGLAHDFNNILGSISGNLEFLERRLNEGRSLDVRRHLDIARGAVQRAATLTHRLLAFSRRQTLDPRPIDLAARVRGMIELIRYSIDPAIDLQLICDDSGWKAFVDADQFDNALLNLCLNSRDAMPSGGQLSVEIATAVLVAKLDEPEDLPPDSYVTVTVTDTGVGMSSDVLSRVFDPFFTTKPLGEGSGLGMSMVWGFVGQSRGHIRIKSEPGQGTRVQLFFPRHKGEIAIKPRTQLTRQSTKAVDGRVILLVEDEEEIRLLVAETLTELGCTVLQVGNGIDAISIIRSTQKLDLLITDVGLPGGVNGYEVARSAIDDRNLKVLFITGYDQTVILDQKKRGPNTRVLTKPFRLSDLVHHTQELTEHEGLVVH